MHPIPKRFPARGMTPDAVATSLEAMRGDDADWRAGRTWSLVYSAGEEHEQVLKDAYLRFFSENGLSPSAFPSLARMEREVVWALLDLLGADAERGGGTMASGGTESIILAVKAYRDASDVEYPSMIVPSTAHPAFIKAGELLRVQPIVIPVTADLVADVDATAAAIDRNTVLLDGSAPAFPYGLVDQSVRSRRSPRNAESACTSTHAWAGSYFRSCVWVDTTFPSSTSRCPG